ncbi:MAG: LPS-assembly protein LptD, partial [Alphaproteobacteria bacterium]
MLILALLCGFPPGAGAQDLPNLPRDLPVTLIADRIEYDGESGLLTARGHVQVFYGKRTLTAPAITYDSRRERIVAEGPLVLRDPDGSTLFASYAALDRDLRNGLLRSARAVLRQRFRLAAVEAQRLGGRYNVLGKAVFSTCVVCAANPVPLWRIRARRIVHDQQAHIIHYEDAAFDVAGMTVFYLPYFRHPDPTVKRSTGFLVPSVRTSDTFGYGLRLPYFVVLDEHSDLTLTPMLTSDLGPLLQAEYRQLFRRGSLYLDGSIKADQSGRDQIARGHLFGQGHYYVTDDVFGHFDIAATSDDGYLSDFEFSEIDRLSSEIAIASYRDRGYWELGGVYFQSLRENERVSAIPLGLPEFDLEQNWTAPGIGGRLGLRANVVGLRRPNGPTGPGVCQTGSGGLQVCDQDTLRGTVAMDWERGWTLPQGILLTVGGSTQFDVMGVWDSARPGTVPEGFATRFTPTAMAEIRYPFINRTESATHILQPIGQIYWSEPSVEQSGLANEDSLLVEFDETNLFLPSRFPGLDRVEAGLRTNLGIRYDRFDADGWSLGVLLGRILRGRKQLAFSGVPALAGAESDYVGAATLDLPPYLKLVERFLLAEDLTLDRNDLRLDLVHKRGSVSGYYSYLSRDILGGAPDPREEFGLTGDLRLADNWKVSGYMAYDMQTERFV